MAADGIGASVRRKEDQRFITGRGTYTDDINQQGQAYAVFVRSPHAHARIRGIDSGKALAAPGVLAVLTGDDVAAAGWGGLICGWMVKSRDGSEMKAGPHPILAQGKVRYVGDHVACVVADTYHKARDAAELVEVDYEVLPACVATAHARDQGQPQVHDDIARNTVYEWELGEQGAVDEAIAKAAHVTTVELVNNRLIPNAIEPRAAVGQYHQYPDEFTLYTTSQNPHVARLVIAAFIGVAPEHKLRVVAPDVGGGFGSKIFIYAEECVCLLAAKKVGRPVKWTADRSESFQSDAHGRDHVDDGAARDGCRRQLHGAQGAHHRQHGRLSVDLRLLRADLSVRDPAGRPVQDARDLLRGRCGLHQHRAGRCVSRRWPARGHLPARDHRRDRGARDRARPGRAAAQELHRQRCLPVPDSGRAAVRHRRTTRRTWTRR